ncbi:MAG TPA: hypothetical protein VM124_01865 [Candidatus Limnocylindrales bacterium]|nr:hypothetical protein [Candidatus Limnocylindrales bacterium]
MAKPTKTTNKKFIPTKRFKLIAASIVAIAAGLMLICYVMKLQKYERLSTSSNQACIGIGIALKHGIELKHFDFDARGLVDPGQGKVAQYKCSVGTVVTKEWHNPDGSGGSEGYELGSDVLYFSNPESAYRFAEKVENPLHSWGIDQEGQAKGIPQTSLFTYLVTDAAEPYFEAYTVRDNAVMHISLPCPMPKNISNPDEIFGNCQATAEKVLREFAETVQHNLPSQRFL